MTLRSILADWVPFRAAANTAVGTLAAASTLAPADNRSRRVLLGLFVPVRLFIFLASVSVKHARRGAVHRDAGYPSDFESFCLVMLFQTATSHALWIPIKRRTIDTAPTPYKLYSNRYRHNAAIASTVA
jgi:hypothetical protein